VILMTFQMNNLSHLPRRLLLHLRHFLIAVFGFVMSITLEGRKNHKPAETWQGPSISPKFMSDQLLVHCGQTF
jgi:hypothetical protein